MDETNTPYANLGPDLILDAVESLGFCCSGSLLALNSYENRVYQIGIEASEPLIAKFYRPQRWCAATILEEHQFALELAGHEIPVVAPWTDAQGQTLFDWQGFSFALFPRKGGRAFELDRHEHLAWMGRFIGRLHAVGGIRRFAHRPTLSIDSHGYQACRLLMEQGFIPVHLQAEYEAIVAEVLTKVEDCFQRAGPLALIRVHGDVHPGNVLWRDEGPHIVDLDDCMMGPAIQDLWMLLSGDRAQMMSQWTAILQGYREHCDFNNRELSLIEALRTLRMLHYSAWLAKRWHDPAFPLNFPWFNSNHYWQEQIASLTEQSRLLNDHFGL